MVKKPIAVFDIDSTLANIDHRLHYILKDKPEWDAFYLACDKDKPNKEIIRICRALHVYGYTTKFVTGRRDFGDMRQMTLIWLRAQGLYVEDGDLLMRAQGDHRPDHEIKWELVRDFAEDIAMVFEDRQSVVDMWRSHGIRTLQVAKGDF